MKEFSLNYKSVETPGWRYGGCCGQFAMTVFLRGLGFELSFDEVFQRNNPMGIYTAPASLVEFLKSLGLKVTQRNNGHYNDILKQLQRGRPVIVLVRCYFSPHWVVVTGYKEDDAGEVVEWEIMDNMWGNREPEDKAYFPHSDFLSICHRPMGYGILGVMAECSNLWIEMDVEEKISQPFISAYGDLPALALNELARAISHLKPHRFLRFCYQFIFCVPSVLIGGPGKIIENIGSIFYWLAGKERKNDFIILKFIRRLLSLPGYIFYQFGRALKTLAFFFGYAPFLLEANFKK
ncbi:C39 family peptidase [Candidatus Riflebacteria bacterium]